MRTVLALLTVGTLAAVFFRPVHRAVAQSPPLVIVDDEASIEELIPLLTQGDGKAVLERADVYDDGRNGPTALRIESKGGDFQKYRTSMPGWEYLIREQPSREDEFRYITFAWRKQGGTGVQFQLHGVPGFWGHRYHAGENMQGWLPSIQVSVDRADDWEVHTRDLVADWGEFVLRGIAFTPGSLDFAMFDHVALHQSEEDPLRPQAVDAAGKLAAVWAGIKQDIR